MLGFEIEVDAKKAEKKLGRIKFKTFMNVGLERLLNEALVKVKQRTPGTGSIREKWKLLIEYDRKTGLISKGVIFNTYDPEDVIHYLEEGTRAHPIRAKKPPWLLVFPVALSDFHGKVPKNPKLDRNGRILMFVSTKNKPIYHPGTKPYKMIGNTFPETLEATLKFARGVQKRVRAKHAARK